MCDNIIGLKNQLETIKNSIVIIAEDVKSTKETMITKDDLKELEAALDSAVSELDDNADRCIFKVDGCIDKLDKLNSDIDKILDNLTNIPVTSSIRKSIRKAYVEYYQDDYGEIKPIEYRYYR